MGQFTLSQEDYAHIIDGKKVTSLMKQGVVNPSTEVVFAHVPIATRVQLEEAVVSAERAFPGWSRTPWEERQEILNDIAALLEKHEEEFVNMLMREVGKDHASAVYELRISAPWVRAVAKEKLEDEVVLEDQEKVVKTRFRPLGVCAGITSFNFPITITLSKLSQALLAGNCIILKAPPTCPCVVLKLIELMQSVVPPGVLSVLSGGDDLGEWMVRHPRIARVSLTGSTTVGRAVMRAAAEELKSLTLELGGNDPAIVLEDADPKVMAQRILLGASHNAGQTCFNMKRIYIHERIYDAVRDELISLAKDVKIGNPFDPDVSIGPVQNKKQHNRLRDLLSECKEKGYKIVFESRNLPDTDRGYFVPLTIVDNPPDDSRLVREEQFGPIIPLLKWNDDNEVVRRANDTEYGLGSSVWGHDMKRIQRIADQLENGMVWINKWGVVGGDLPLVGVKHSGLSVESSRHGLMAWTYVQSWVCSKM